MIEHEYRAAALETVERLLMNAYARDRVSAALYESLVDGLSFGPCELPRVEEREWLRGAIAVPIQEATNVALRTLAWQITRALEQAPSGLLDRLDQSRRWQGLGWE
jgi:hypothetical protein